MRPGKPLAAVAVVAATVLTAMPALAGAPAFECRIGSIRIGLDTHRSVALVRQPSGPIMRFGLAGVEAAGVNQRYLLTSGSISAFVDVRGAGSHASTDISGGVGFGVCAFVPGDFAIGRVTAVRVNVRVASSPDADIAVILRRGSLVWLDPTPTAGEGGDDGMRRVRVVVHVRGGRVGGGEQQLGMGSEAGLDGRSTVIDGWVRTRGIEWLGLAGP